MPMGIIENRRRSALILALGKTAGTLTMCSRIYTITWLRISDKWGPAHMYICMKSVLENYAILFCVLPYTATRRTLLKPASNTWMRPEGDLHSRRIQIQPMHVVPERKKTKVHQP